VLLSHAHPAGDADVQVERRVVTTRRTHRVSRGPGGIRFPGFFFSAEREVSMAVPSLSRDWWAVLLAALAVVLVKLGVIEGVRW